MLVVPADLPLLETAGIDALVAQAQLSPSKFGTGPELLQPKPGVSSGRSSVLDRLFTGRFQSEQGLSPLSPPEERPPPFVHMEAPICRASSVKMPAGAAAG